MKIIVNAKKKAITVILVFRLLDCWNSAFLGFSIFSCLRVVVFPEANKILFERDLDLAGRALHFNQKTAIQLPPRLPNQGLDQPAYFTGLF